MTLFYQAQLGVWPGNSACFRIMIRPYQYRSYHIPTCGSINILTENCLIIQLTATYNIVMFVPFKYQTCIRMVSTLVVSYYIEAKHTGGKLIKLLADALTTQATTAGSNAPLFIISELVYFRRHQHGCLQTSFKLRTPPDWAFPVRTCVWNFHRACATLCHRGTIFICCTLFHKMQLVPLYVTELLFLFAALCSIKCNLYHSMSQRYFYLLHLVP